MYKTASESTQPASQSHENLHHISRIIINSTPPSGAYCRNMAWMLMFRAALRYFSDSDRRDVDRCDIPAGPFPLAQVEKTRRTGRTVKRISSPQQLLHVLRHDTRNVLQFIVQLVQRATGSSSSASVLVQSSCLRHECVCETSALLERQGDQDWGSQRTKAHERIRFPYSFHLRTV